MIYDATRGVSLSDRSPNAFAETADERMKRTNPRAYDFAEARMRDLANGVLIDGVNCAGCSHAGCDEIIEWADNDIDGPDVFQLQGVKCADHWACNKHADRKSGWCIDCIAQGCVA